MKMVGRFFGEYSNTQAFSLLLGMNPLREPRMLVVDASGRNDPHHPANGSSRKNNPVSPIGDSGFRVERQ